MIPEAAVAMLSCARIGAAHSVVFGGFSSQALADRINDAEAKVLITADGGYRRGEVFELKPAADEAIASTPTTQKIEDVAMRFHVYNAWPTAVAYSDLNAGDNSLFVEQMTLVHEGFDAEWSSIDATGNFVTAPEIKYTA
jgi:phage tail-like protein